MKGLQSLVILLTLTLIPTYSYAKDYGHYADRCEPIREEVQEILLQDGVSEDYFFLLVAENHCTTKKSSAGAVGYWQMLPSTARENGCDDPEDLVCETHAAANYLKKLEVKCGKENVIFCWHDGGSNFLRHGKVASKAAKGLDWMYRHFKKTFYASQWAGKSEDEEG